MLELSVVVPVFNAENCLGELCQRLIAALETIVRDFEIIFVEDCSRDNSWRVIHELSKCDERIIGIRMSRNFGQHAATICGVSHAQGQWVVTIDDDLEHRPEDIPKLLEKAKQGFDLVYGVYAQRTHSAWRNLTSEAARRLFKFAIPNLNYQYTSFRIIQKNIASAMCRFQSPFPFVDGYLSWLTNNYATVSVEHCARIGGVSNYSFGKLLVHTINIIAAFSDLPLKMATWMGVGAFLIGMIWLVLIVLGKIFGGITVSGFASLMAGIVLFGGIQMLVLGVLGEYLGRINFKTSQKPLYLVVQKTDDKGAEGK